MVLQTSLKHHKNELLNQYTTFKIGGAGKDLYIPESIEELIGLLKEFGVGSLLIGYGSNLLISSKGYEGSIIITKSLNKIVFKDNGNLSVETGAFSPVVAKACLDSNLSGLEFLGEIPGSIGGAIIMNSSANEQCISENLIEVKVFCLESKEIKTYRKEKIRFSYRKCSIDSMKEVILSAKFHLRKDTYNNILNKMQQNKTNRELKQPKGFNAGSIFKNPSNTKFSAGYLLEQSGVKGWVEGGAEVSKLHANFIINVNKATSEDVSRLMLRMHNAVKEHTGVKLVPEIKYIGKPTKEENKIWKILKAQ